MIHNNKVKKIMIDSIIKNGYSRTINSYNYNLLENKISNLHNKQTSLIFNSDYFANYSSIKSFGYLFKDAEIFSDEIKNNSIINGIKASKLKNIIFKHNDLNNLEYLLKKSKSSKKIIIVEAINSLSGNIIPFNDLKILKYKYNCLIYLDESNSVGLYGQNGAGLSEYFNAQNDIDIISGGFYKGFGIIGGYTTGDKDIIEYVKNFNLKYSSLIYLPEPIICGLITSIDEVSKIVVKNQFLRNKLIEHFILTSIKLDLPLINNNFYKSHFQFINIKNIEKDKNIKNILLNKHNHFVDNIKLNYSLNKNEGKLRLSIKYCHSNEMINELLNLIKKYIF